MRSLDRIFVAAMLTCAMAITTVSAADLKIGVVNLQRVMEASPQAEVARSKLEKEFSARENKLIATQKELKASEDRMSKDGAIMSETERSRLERDVVNKRRDLKRDTQEIQEDMNFRRNEELATIQQQIGEAIVALAKDQAFDTVLGNGVIFASPKVDLTDQVIERLKKGGSAPAAKQ